MVTNVQHKNINEWHIYYETDGLQFNWLKCHWATRYEHLFNCLMILMLSKQQTHWFVCNRIGNMNFHVNAAPEWNGYSSEFHAVIVLIEWNSGRFSSYWFIA